MPFFFSRAINFNLRFLQVIQQFVFIHLFLAHSPLFAQPEHLLAKFPLSVHVPKAGTTFLGGDVVGAFVATIRQMNEQK